MKLAGLFILFMVQLALFLSVWIYEEDISRKYPKLGKILGISYVAISCVIIAYAILFLIYISNTMFGFYSSESTKIVYQVYLIIVIVANIIKLLYVLLDYKEMYGILENIMKEVYIGSIVVVIMVTMLCAPVSFSNESYILPEDRTIVDKFDYKKVELSVNTQNGNYNLIVKDKDDQEYTIDKSIDKVNAEHGDYKYVEKYKVKETLENAYEFKKEKIYYEYILYTNDSVEANLVNYYGLNK